MGVLYMGGKKLGDVEVVLIPEPQSCKDKDGIISGLPREINIEMKTHISPWAELFLLTGKWPANNWMKMQGGIMKRKAQIRKAKKMMQKKPSMEGGSESHNKASGW